MTASIATISEYALRGQSLTARWGLAATYLQGKVYVFGGYLWFHGVEGFFNDLYELDLSTSIVRRLVPENTIVPPVRFGHTLVADKIRNQLILFGGRNTTESFNDLWTYDISTNQWVEIVLGTPPPRASENSRHSVPSSSSTPSLVDETLLLHHKRSASNKRSDISSIQNTHIQSKLTAETSSLSPQPRSWHTATYHQNEIYVYGGWNHSNRVFNDLWCFDLITYQWTCINPPDAMSKPPHGRSCHQATAWNDSLYIFGGLRDGDAVVGDMWKYSFENKTWSPVECSGIKPSGRTSSAGALVNDSWVIHGGLSDYPRAGIAAISDVIEFHFPTNTWIHRTEILSDGTSSAGRRYGHVAISQPGHTSLLLLNGAEKYGSASQSPACRVDLLPSQAEVTEIQQDLIGTTRISQVNRERITELIEAAQTYEVQIRALKAENASLGERCQMLQTQMSTLHQQQSALQNTFQSIQQGLASVEQFIPMMKSVGAAIANFGNVATAWATPGSTSSLSRNTGGMPTTSQTAMPLQSTSELR